MIRIEPRTQVPAALAIAVPVIAAIAALALAAIVFAFTDMSVHRGYQLVFAGALGSLSALGATLAHAALLMLTGLAAAIAFRVKLWNLGGEGQFQAGALAALAVGSAAAASPGFVTVPLVLIGGALAGALLMLAPALLRVWRGTDEAIVTLLINVMMIILMPALLAGPHAGAELQPRAMAAASLLPDIGWLLGAHAGLPIALVAVIAAALALPFTIWGFMLRATAGNAIAARFAGIKVDRVLVSVGLISGALAGVAGAVALAAGSGGLAPGFGAGIGCAGIAIAVLAGRSLPGIIIAALFVAILQTGAAALPNDGASAPAGDILVALVLLCALIASTLVRFRVHRLRTEGAAP